MAAPKTPAVTPAPVNPEIDSAAQADADEAARRAKERQQQGVSASKTILTSGLGVTDDENVKKASLG